MTTTCELCGCDIDTTTEQTFSRGDLTLCDVCYDASVQCCECGRVIDTTEDEYYETADGDYYCDDCGTEELTKCDSCGEYHRNDDLHQLINDDWYCEECLDSCHRCDCCDGYFDPDRSHHYRCGDNVVHCPNCVEDFEECEECGRVENRDDMHWSDNRECWLCDECYEGDLHPAIHEYSWRPPKYDYKSCPHERDTSKLYMGVELEYSTDGESYQSDVANAIDSDVSSPLFYMKEDGSLSDGVECVSHPMTLDYWTTKETRDTITKIMKVVDHYSWSECTLNYGGRVNDDRNGNDGLHVHVTSAGMIQGQSLFISWFMGRCRQQCEMLAGRKESSYATYLDVYQNIGYTDICELYHKNGGRYRALNTTPDRTIEFRIFASTTNPENFYRRLMFCHALYQYAKRAVSMVNYSPTVLEETFNRYDTMPSHEIWQEFVDFTSQDVRYYDLYRWLTRNTLYLPESTYEIYNLIQRWSQWDYDKVRAIYDTGIADRVRDIYTWRLGTGQLNQYERTAPNQIQEAWRHDPAITGWTNTGVYRDESDIDLTNGTIDNTLYDDDGNYLWGHVRDTENTMAYILYGQSQDGDMLRNLRISSTTAGCTFGHIDTWVEGTNDILIWHNIDTVKYSSNLWIPTTIGYCNAETMKLRILAHGLLGRSEEYKRNVVKRLDERPYDVSKLMHHCQDELVHLYWDNYPKEDLNGDAILLSKKFEVLSSLQHVINQVRDHENTVAIRDIATSCLYSDFIRRDITFNRVVTEPQLLYDTAGDFLRRLNDGFFVSIHSRDFPAVAEFICQTAIYYMQGDANPRSFIIPVQWDDLRGMTVVKMIDAYNIHPIYDTRVTASTEFITQQAIPQQIAV